MKNNLSYTENLERLVRRASRKRNHLEAKYYSGNIGATSACVSWERYRSSWAGLRWIAANS